MLAGNIPRLQDSVQPGLVTRAFDPFQNRYGSRFEESFEQAAKSQCIDGISCRNVSLTYRITGMKLRISESIRQTCGCSLGPKPCFRAQSCHGWTLQCLLINMAHYIQVLGEQSACE